MGNHASLHSPHSINAWLHKVCLLFMVTFGAAAAAAQPISTPDPPALKAEELEQLVAPVALYSDTLLAQVLIASTYPLEVALAAQWLQQNSKLQGAPLNTALEAQTWDASVKALVQIPTALQQMSHRLDWTQKLGDAFLAQQKDVMDAVQRLRQRAQTAGTLMTTEQQKVVAEGQTIVIEQADPQTVYVPYYDPFYAYGSWPYAGYPPYYWPPPPGYYLGAGLAFGLGVAVIGGIWNNSFDWNGGDLNVDIDRNRFTNIDSDRLGNRRENSQRWQHNAEHRRGSNYRDQATRERFGRGDASQANARQNSRGFDQAQVRDQLGQRGNANLQRSSLERSGRTNGFDRMGSASGTRGFSNRGQSSRMASGRGFSGGGGRGGFGGGGGRGGGGGGRR